MSIIAVCALVRVTNSVRSVLSSLMSIEPLLSLSYLQKINVASSYLAIASAASSRWIMLLCLPRSSSRGGMDTKVLA